MKNFQTICNLSDSSNSKFKIQNSKFFLLLLFCLFLLNGCVSEQPEEIKRGLVIYKASNIEGYDNQQIIVDPAFVPYMNIINNYAKENNVVVYVTHSFRKKNQKLTGIIVPPAVKSNHLVGHAIDMNVFFNGILYESKDMYKAKWNSLPLNVKNFLEEIRKNPILQWGGDFEPEDPVHIDDQLVERNPMLWQKLYNTYQ